jgi:hypothetical protein
LILSSMPTVCALFPSVSERQEQRNHRDQQSNLLVLVFRRLWPGAAAVSMLLVSMWCSTSCWT